MQRLEQSLSSFPPFPHFLFLPSCRGRALRKKEKEKRKRFFFAFLQRPGRALSPPGKSGGHLSFVLHGARPGSALSRKSDGTVHLPPRPQSAAARFKVDRNVEEDAAGPNRNVIRNRQPVSVSVLPLPSPPLGSAEPTYISIYQTVKTDNSPHWGGGAGGVASVSTQQVRSSSPSAW